MVIIPLPPTNISKTILRRRKRYQTLFILRGHKISIMVGVQNSIKTPSVIGLKQAGAELCQAQVKLD
jgi:hypothetical protein